MIEKLQAIWNLVHELDLELEKKLEEGVLDDDEEEVLNELHLIEMRLENMGVVHP
jgi:hypothetical protein